MVLPVFQEAAMQRLKKILRGNGSAHLALISAFVLCGMYFASWCLINHWAGMHGAMIFYR